MRAYTSGPGFPRGLVIFKDAETGKLATRTPTTGRQALEQLFDLVERALATTSSWPGPAVPTT